MLTIPECDGRTDGWTDASMMAKTREALHAVARKNGRFCCNVKQHACVSVVSSATKNLFFIFAAETVK